MTPLKPFIGNTIAIKPEITGGYGNYSSQTNSDKLERLRWATDTLSYLRRNKNAKLMPANFAEICCYAEQLFWHSYYSSEKNPIENAHSRRMNKVMGGFVDYGLRSGDLRSESAKNWPNYTEAKQLALSLFPEEQTCTWGDMLMVFETVATTYPKDKQQFIVNQALSTGRQNFMPVALEDFCYQLISPVGQNQIDKNRYQTVLDNLSELGYEFTTEQGLPVIVSLQDKTKLLTERGLIRRRQSTAKNLGDQTLASSVETLVA